MCAIHLLSEANARVLLTNLLVCCGCAVVMLAPTLRLVDAWAMCAATFEDRENDMTVLVTVPKGHVLCIKTEPCRCRPRALALPR